MTVLFYFCLCLCVIIFQSTIAPNFRFLDRIYDLLLPFFTYLGLFRPARTSVPVIIVCGVVMDSLTGGPFGLYMSSYLWLYVGIRWLIKIFDVSHSLLVLFIVPLAVLFQNAVTMVAFFALKQDSPIPESAAKIVVIQLLWALLTGPLFLICFDYVHKRWDRWVAKVEDMRNG